MSCASENVFAVTTLQIRGFLGAPSSRVIRRRRLRRLVGSVCRGGKAQLDRGFLRRRKSPSLTLSHAGRRERMLLDLVASLTSDRAVMVRISGLCMWRILELLLASGSACPSSSSSLG